MEMQTEVKPRHDYSAGLGILKQRFGNRAFTSNAVRELHGRGEGYFPCLPPDLVIFVKTAQEVAEIVTICAEHVIPVIPFGVGTSLEGHVNAVEGGVTIDMSDMNKVLEINAQDLDCRVQAGVTREQLNAELRTTGLFFPIDPGANATIGGMSATRASGTNAVRYGTMRENVLGLSVVTPDGKIVKTGGRARKSAAGYDLTRLFVGSEGTLGVITEIQLKLYGIPEAITSAVCQYPDLESAINTVILTIQSGIPVARIELLDEMQMKGCIQYSKLEGYAEKPTLFFEFHGTKASAAEQAEQVKAFSDEFGGSAFQWSAKTEDRTKLWKARHDAYFACKSLAPGKDAIATDACVPISRLAECLLETKKDIQDSGLLAPIVGHVGDGNFHLLVLVEPGQGEEFERAKKLIDRMTLRTLAFGGTCTGEHGIGMGKKQYLHTEHGEAVALMHIIKQSFDPKNIMNPGKVVTL